MQYRPIKENNSMRASSAILVGVVVLMMAAPACRAPAGGENLHPNILWLFIDDQDPRYGCYEEGLHVPLIIAAPGMTETVKPGTIRTDLTSLMDVAATSLALAGLEIPAHMDSKNLFADDYKRDHIYSSRDRCSFTIDRIRYGS